MHRRAFLKSLASGLAALGVVALPALASGQATGPVPTLAVKKKRRRKPGKKKKGGKPRSKKGGKPRAKKKGGKSGGKKGRTAQVNSTG